jgi:hypothetical protein
MRVSANLESNRKHEIDTPKKHIVIPMVKRLARGWDALVCYFCFDVGMFRF